MMQILLFMMKCGHKMYRTYCNANVLTLASLSNLTKPKFLSFRNVSNYKGHKNVSNYKGHKNVSNDKGHKKKRQPSHKPAVFQTNLEKLTP